MRAIKINIAGGSFLLPESHGSYEFPAYILENKELIEQFIAVGAAALKAPMEHHDIPDVSELKRVTGIIGFPFDMRDPELYALDAGVQVVMEVDL